MSSIVFNQEHQQQLDSSSLNKIRNVFVETLTFEQSDSNGAQTETLKRNDVCEKVLGNKMAVLELNEAITLQHQQSHNNNDGSDSGVEIATSTNMTLQRALSSNSGGYASSSGGVDETTHGLNMSCDSSMVSCGSDLGEPKVTGGSCNIRTRSANNYECCSENGSESSSIAGAGSPSAANTRKPNTFKKKVAMVEPTVPSVRNAKERGDNIMSASAVEGALNSLAAVRPRLSTLKRTASLPRPSQLSSLQTRERINDKCASNVTKATPAPAAVAARNVAQTRAIKPQKPDSLPNALSRTQSISMQRLIQRTASLSRVRMPGTPSDDGRWPGVGNPRLPAVTNTTRRGKSVTSDVTSLKVRSNMLVSMDTKSSTLSAYGTLPRRRKQKSVEDLTAITSRSSSISRDSRMSSSVVLSAHKNLLGSHGVATDTSTPTSAQAKIIPIAPFAANKNSAVRNKLPQTKTRIYHESSAQTALTSDDLAKAFAGEASTARPVDAAEQRDQQTQSDIRDREVERLHEEMRQLTQREHERSMKLQREREEKLAMQRELHLNTERIMGMLERARIASGNGVGAIIGSGGNININCGSSSSPLSDGGSCGHDSLLMLESQIQLSGNELIERQQEISQLRQLCHSLQSEMERSLSAQECLLHEKAAIEQESSELQDFLQHEKAAMCDALKEMESEYQMCKRQLMSREEEVKVLRDECRHLVRLNEQRRQENRLLQTKYAALESKCKELVLQQNASNAGASSALSGLHTRLDSLVEQLVSTYNISEQDLEDIAFQNETLPGSGSIIVSGTGSDTLNDIGMQQMSKMANTNRLDLTLHSYYNQLPQTSEGSLSPQRNQSFIAAVISAIRNATTPSSKKLSTHTNKVGTVQNGSSGNNNNNNNPISNEDDETCRSDESDSTEMLDSETEPCLMMDNVLEDVTMPDSHSHNMVSACTSIVSQIDIPYDMAHACASDNSLHNLSQAIVNRQQMELQIKGMSVQKVEQQLNQYEHSTSEDGTHGSAAEMPSLMEFCVTQSVVDQVIEVDSLVTRLLKILRLIQMENDSCIRQLILDKNKLQQNKEDMLEKLKDLEDENVKLQDELMDATQELMVKNNDLSNTKAEMQRHRNEIDRLTEDICNLSTLCSNYKKLSPTAEFPHLKQHPLLTIADDVENGDVTPGGANEADNEAFHILSLLKMWQTDGQLKDTRVLSFLSGLLTCDDKNERLRIYANQLENIFKTLGTCDNLEQQFPSLKELLNDIKVVKLNADWTNLVDMNAYSSDEDINANDATKTVITQLKEV